MKKGLFYKSVFCFTVSFTCLNLWAQTPDAQNPADSPAEPVEIYTHVNEALAVFQNDIIVEGQKTSDGMPAGVDLYIRKKEGIASVMLVETTKDPNGKEANYAYRATEYNPVNGDEIRYLNGQELKSEYSKYSLISSTVTKHPVLGDSFHIYIPQTIVYGYPWSRNGVINIDKGTFINLRTFPLPYGDYSQGFQDNPFMFDFAPVVKKTVPEPELPQEEVYDEPVEEVVLTDDYNSVAAQKFAEIAKDAGGVLTFSKGPESLTEDLLNIVDSINPKKIVDVVFAIDTTGSMKDDMEALKTQWVPKFIEQLKTFDDIRVGLLFYRDYVDSYSFKGLPVKQFAFTKDVNQFIKCLNTARIHGNEGGDVPEAVYEALYGSIQYYDWRKDAVKRIILIGDAEPHPTPRDPRRKLTKEYVTSLAKDKDIVFECIIVPDDKAGSRKR